MLVIQIRCEEQGLCGKLKRGMGRITLEKQAIRDGYFEKMTVFSRVGRIKWKKIRKALHGHPVCAVISEGIQPPVGCGIARYDSGEFRENLLFRAFLQAMSFARPVTAGFWDEKGECVTAAENLLPLVGQLRICTPCPEAYADLMERAVADYGTAPLLSEDGAVLQNTAALFLPEEIEPPMGGVLFSQSHGYGVADGGLILPADVLAAIPDGISPLDFAAAAVEAGLIGEEEVRCSALTKNGGINSLHGLCRQMI